VESSSHLSLIEISHKWGSEGAWWQGTTLDLVHNLLLGESPGSVVSGSPALSGTVLLALEGGVYRGAPANTVDVVNVDIFGQCVELDVQKLTYLTQVRHTETAKIAVSSLHALTESIGVK